MRSPRSGRSRGFTLLEVLVAMMILGIALGAAMSAVGGYLKNQSYLRDRTVAHWVARNTLAQWQLLRQWPELGQRSETTSMAGVDWEWRVQVTETVDDDLRRLDIEVRHADGEGEPVAWLVGFVGRPGA